PPSPWPAPPAPSSPRCPTRPRPSRSSTAGSRGGDAPRGRARASTLDPRRRKEYRWTRLGVAGRTMRPSIDGGTVMQCVRAWVAGVVVLDIACLGRTAVAQTAPAPPPGETPSELGEPAEQIVVTGSAIRRKDLLTPAPLTTLTREDIDALGL